MMRSSVHDALREVLAHGGALLCSASSRGHRVAPGALARHLGRVNRGRRFGTEDLVSHQQRRTARGWSIDDLRRLDPLVFGGKIPLTAPLAMPNRIAMGATTWWDPVVAVVRILAVIAGLVVIGEDERATDARRTHRSSRRAGRRGVRVPTALRSALQWEQRSTLWRAET
jgi:hypothetical protein